MQKQDINHSVNEFGDYSLTKKLLQWVICVITWKKLSHKDDEGTRASAIQAESDWTVLSGEGSRGSYPWVKLLDSRGQRR